MLTWGHEEEQAQWLPILIRLVYDSSTDAMQHGGFSISVPWWAFAGLRHKLLEVFRAYNLAIGSEIEIDENAVQLLRQSTQNVSGYERASTITPVPPEEVVNRLSVLGFSRTLTPEQLRNVCYLASLPAAATFSVPGAGKTTEALACFFYRSRDTDKLLVVAPKNAFAAWEEELAECIPTGERRFIRLQGGYDRIARLLDQNPPFMLMTYQQFPRVRELIAKHMADHRVHLYLDESHRIKSGIGRQTPQAILSVSHLPVGKLIMSGTPMPQAIDDLVPQLTFLYPEIPVVAETVVSMIKPIYVRTTKNELGLPPVQRTVHRLSMAPVQDELYKLMKFEVAREAAAALSIRSKQAFRALGRSVARLLQFVSNPTLLSSEIGFAHADLLRAVLAEGDGPKLEHTLNRARALTSEGHKVLIWSSFVRNVEYVSERLSDLGAVYIHGGVTTGDEDDEDTREGRIRLFHDDANVKVLVANPAAASEGVSLHKVCHHSIYLDRTFNAAHYLQSEDRIHRLGLSPEQLTFIEIVECKDTVDETVRERLSQKINAMAQALEDPSLHVDPIPLDPVSIEDPEDYLIGIEEDDVKALIGK